jgi:hypothetical protein
VGCKFSKFRKKKIEYKFSVKRFPIWCHKSGTMFFVDKSKQIPFIYHKNRITAFLVICYNCLNAQEQRAFKSTPVI